MSEKEPRLLGECDKGGVGQPGSDYVKLRARVYLLSSGRFEMQVRHAWGSNQGHLEEHGSKERRYRASTLDELLRVAVTEIRADRDLEDDGRLVAAAREAVFEAEDAIEKVGA